MSILIDYRKYPDTPHWHYTMEPLGEDEHGTWLWAPAGTTFQRGTEPPITTDAITVKLIRPGNWWSGLWSPSPTTAGQWRVYINIIAPAEWHTGSVRMIDLDLDVYRKLDGGVRLLDEAEFAENQVALHYPQQLIDGARTTADRLFDLVKDGKEPFGTTGLEWLAAASAQGRDSG